jgi:ABC-type methionine transport system permease subunit
VYAPVNSELVTNTGFVDEDVTLGTRYYYVVRSVDLDPSVAESVDSESVSIVPTAPAASLGGAVAGNSHGGGGGGCFVSTASEAFNRDIMRGLTLFGVIIVFGMLATRRKAYGSKHRA